jgi:5'-3' exonuclease
VLSGVAGLLDQLLFLVREQGATHVGCATDRVIESFRNDLYPGYKSSVGMDPVLLDQFPIAEAAMEAAGFVVWPMVEFEADDAIATAASRWADAPGVERVVICTPDKDMAQLVRDGLVVLWDRRRGIVYDEAGVIAKWGVPPGAVADRLALVGDAADGYPGLRGWGAKSTAAVLAKFGHLEQIPPDWRTWGVNATNPAALARTLDEQRELALLFRTLATLRTDVPTFGDVSELEWTGPRPEFAALAESFEAAARSAGASKRLR